MAIKTIYKICSADEWKMACAATRFTGADVDVRDGFIHFSTAAQVRKTAHLHFNGRHNLLLLAVNASCLGADLKWEASRGGDMFPHLYAALDVEAVKSVTALPVADDGEHVFPALEE